MTREKPGFRYGNYEKESFMLSVFIVTEVLSPKLYQNITGCSLSPVLFPVSLGLQWHQQEVWTSLHPALLTHRSVINPKQSPLSQLTAPATSWDPRIETSTALGGNNMKIGKRAWDGSLCPVIINSRSTGCSRTEQVHGAVGSLNL